MTENQVPVPVKTESRTCFGLAFFTSEADADRYAQYVRERGITFNGGFRHGQLCGRESAFDRIDPELGQLFAVTD